MASRKKSYLVTHSTAPVPQSEALPGQVANNAGGFTFKLDPWKVLERFLVLGSEGGTYYVNESKLTKDNAKNVEALIKLDGKRVIDTVVRISEEGRAPSNDPALFVHALASVIGDSVTRQLAY